MHNILVIDDEKDIVDLLRVYLEKENYSVYTAFNSAEGIENLHQNQIDLVLLDIMLPDTDGIETCRIIREKFNIPIIMLSAKSEEMDKILGLGIGADDYVVKPFNPSELMARIKSQLRRYLYFNKRDSSGSNIIRINNLEINLEKHEVLLEGESISLTPTEYKILYLLASCPGKVFSSEEIFRNVWKEKYFESNNTVMVHVWRLREKVETDPKNPEIIQTVWGVGYKIEKEKL